MASRDRTCRHLVPPVTASMPPPATLARLAPLMATLMDCAAEYQACADPDEQVEFDATDWVRWLDLAVRNAVQFREVA